VLQEKEFERVGESRTIRVDVRVVAATNTSLEQAVEDGEFREDLYYRLNVIPIALPPLRERRDDIPLLAEFFVKRYGELHKCPVPELTPLVLDALKAYDWPGNVRELENTLERLIVFADGGPITSEMLRFGRVRPIIRGPRGSGTPTDVPSLIHALVRAGMHAPRPEPLSLHEFLVDGVERELIEEVLRECGGNQVQAARRLGINRNTLHKKREDYRKADGAGSADAPAAETPDEPPASAAG
jgi:Nif-specific regulatory protein